MNNRLFAAIVVVYNFDARTLLMNIESYIHEIDHLYIIDNSDVNCILPDSFDAYGDKCTYICLGYNKGIAYALNYGCTMALNDNYSWVFTFDQDSKIEQGYISAMLLWISQHEVVDIAIVAPIVNLQFHCTIETSINEFSFVDSVLASGNLVNLSAYSAVNGFKDELFIDWVDIDFCYRLRLRNYRIVILKNCILSHQLGNTKEYRLAGKHLFYSTNHTPIRYYYKSRNALLLAKDYWNCWPLKSMGFLKSVLTDYFKILFCESNVCQKVSFIHKGIYDAFRGRTGIFHN